MSALSRDAGASTLGVTGDTVQGSLSESVAAGPGWYPLVVLGGVAGVVLAQGVSLLLAPDIAASRGGSATSVGGAMFAWVGGAVLGLPVALRAALGRRRVRAAAVGGALVCLGLLAVSLAGSLVWVATGAALGGIGAVLVGATHRALLADLYPPFALTHVLVAFRAVSLAVGGLAVVLAFPFAGALDLTWRASLLLVALLAAVVTVAVAGLAEPEAGGQEGTRLRRLAGAEEVEVQTRRPGFGEALRRLYAIPTVRPLLALIAVLASVAYGLVVFGSYALTERGGLASGATPWVVVGAALAGAATLVDRGGRVAALLRTSPAGLASWSAVVVAVGGLSLAVVGFAPWPAVQVLALVVAVATLGLGLVVVDRLLLLVSPVELRGVAGATADTYAALMGVGLGGSVLAAVDRANGLGVGLAVLGGVAVVGGFALRLIGRLVASDMEATAGSLVEAVQSSVDRSRGVRPPLLTCRGIDFSYGPLQILFDVDFTVDEGEMVALLGTNGAGKSTLLRVISGLGLPSAGTVRLAGDDLTYAEPGERVRAGVCQIPGGKAVFGPLSVADNLRLYGYALGRDKKTIDRGIDEAFATFPRLAERRNAPSSTMSGGEQQMLALSKALILKPRLLLIDELSLGLAPKVVGELLTLVRKINDTGTAVVLVEQSVNVALSLAEHAYFMEKGQVRFDGATADLLERPDILRSVFLSGVAAGAGA